MSNIPVQINFYEEQSLQLTPINDKNSNKMYEKLPHYATEEPVFKMKFGRKCRKAIWTQEEDEVLKKLVEKYGANSWGLIADSIPRRSGKQCRQRWHNHLRLGVKKGQWQYYQFWILALGAAAYGKKWSKIAQHLPGRTDNSIKNQWNCKMKPYKEKFNKQIQYLLQRQDEWSELGQIQINLLQKILNKNKVEEHLDQIDQMFSKHFKDAMEQLQAFDDYKYSICETNARSSIEQPKIQIYQDSQSIEIEQFNDFENIFQQINPFKDQIQEFNEQIQKNSQIFEVEPVNQQLEIDTFDRQPLKQNLSFQQMIKQDSPISPFICGGEFIFIENESNFMKQPAPDFFEE